MGADLSDELRRRMFAAGGGASARTLKQWGLSEGRLRRLTRDGFLIRVAHGGYTLPTTADRSWERRRSDHLKALAAQLTPDAVAGLRSAALVWGLPVAEIPPRPEVIRPPHAARRHGVRTVCSPLPPAQVTTIHGVPVTTLERTGVDVAVDVPIPQALVTVDAALRQGADRALLWAVLRGRGTVAGVRNARSTLSWADEFAETPIESRGRGELMVHGVPRPACNLTFAFHGETFRPDVAWDGYGVVGEADGREKYGLGDTPEETLWAEKLRQEWFENELGLQVFRWVDREMRFAAAEAAARWHSLAARPAARLWKPPDGLRVFREPRFGPSGSSPAANPYEP